MKVKSKLTAVVLALTVLTPALLPWAAEAQVMVTVIHNGMAINVSLLAVPWHLLRGDTFPEPSCRLQTLDGGARVSPFTVGKELRHGGTAMVEPSRTGSPPC